MRGRLSRGIGKGLVALLGTAGLAACSTPTALVATGEPGQVCVPASVDGEATVGLDILENFSSGPVKVTSATVADKNGLQVVGWSLVEPGSPHAEVSSGYAQPDARDDARMIPAGDRAILVLGLRLQSPPGTSTAVTVTYLEGGREGTTQTVNSLKVVPAGQVCTSSTPRPEG